MLRLANVIKDYPIEHGIHRAVDRVSFELAKGEKIALLGRNGAGKSTLIRLLTGVELPSSGRIDRKMTMSWPLGFDGGFQGGMTGNDNMRFISRIYQRPFDEVRRYVEDFAELGKYMSEPVKTYSTGMRARLAFGLSLAIEFDCYVIDEVIGAGDQRFRRKSEVELFQKRTDRSLIMASHDASLLRSTCSKALIMYRGQAKVFDDLDLALDIYKDL